jgi:hypothetical protein
MGAIATHMTGSEGRVSKTNSCYCLPVMDWEGGVQVICACRVNDIRTMAVSRMLADMGKIFPEASPTLSQLKTMEVGCSCSLDWIICMVS